MTNRSEQGLLARQLLKQQSFGVLSTHSLEVEGYSFCSITPYTLNYDCEPIILISSIAQHTRNILKNPKVSLTIFDPFVEDLQASSRLTWLGDAEMVSSDDTESQLRYLRYFPSAQTYFDMHDFNLCCIKLRLARFIGGFGQIHWLEPATLIEKNPLHDVEANIVEHMNEDHGEALINFCRELKGIEGAKVRMAGIDREGIDILVGKRKVRIEFTNGVETAEEARDELIKLAKQTRRK